MNSNHSKRTKYDYDADDQILLDNTETLTDLNISLATNSSNENLLEMKNTSNGGDDESVSLESNESMDNTLIYNEEESWDIGSLVCCVPECYKSNKYNKEKKAMNNKADSKGIILYSPPSIDVIKDWSDALGVPLTLQSLLCEKHFKMEDIVHIKSDEGIVEDIIILPGIMPILQQNPHASKTQKADEINNTLLRNKPKKNSIDGPQRTTTYNSLESVSIELTDKISLTFIDDSINTDTILELNHDNIATTSSTSFMSKTMQSNFKQSKEKSENTLDISDAFISVENLKFDHFSPPDNKSEQLNCIFDKDSSDNININVCGETNLTEENDIIFKDLNSILKICESIRVPTILWKCLIQTNLNHLLYIEQDPCIGIIKKVLFHSNLVPKIYINKKRYKYNMPVKTKHELEDLLEKISDIEICKGYDNFVNDKCLGYFESASEETEVCYPCYVFAKKCKSKMKAEVQQKLNTIKTLEESIAIKEVRLKRIREMFRKRQND